MQWILAMLVLAGTAWGQTIAYSDAVIAHLPIGCDFTPSIILVNPTPRIVKYKISFFSLQGIPKDVSINKVFGTSTSGTVSPNGSAVIQLDESDATGDDCCNWAEVSSDEVLAGYVEMVQKTSAVGPALPGGGRLSLPVEARATVPFVSRFANRFLVPFSMRSGQVTAMALVNPSGDKDVKATLRYRNSDGTLIRCETRRFLRREQQAFELSPQLNGTEGVIEVSADALEFGGFALRFGNPGFISFPAQTPLTRADATPNDPKEVCILVQ